MKTMLLFSSVFYLLGLKLGNTIEVFKKVVLPVKSVISAPASKPENTGKNYYLKPAEPVMKNKTDKKDSTNAGRTSEYKLTGPIQGDQPC